MAGVDVAMPLALAPVGMAGMSARRGEAQGARAAMTAGVPFTTSTVGICPVEEVAAVGRANMIKGDWIKPGAVVIDVGINRIEVEVDGETKSKLTGDVDYDSACEVAKAVTPVPGGVGPMTITMLMFNTLRAARLSAGLGD